MQYEEGERDMVILQHKFEIKLKDGTRVCTYVLIKIYMRVSCISCFINFVCPLGNLDIYIIGIWKTTRTIRNVYIGWDTMWYCCSINIRW